VSSGSCETAGREKQESAGLNKGVCKSNTNGALVSISREFRSIEKLGVDHETAADDIMDEISES
jgi:hypothetical protein